MNFMHANMIGNVSPGVVGLSTHGAVVCMDYMYDNMISHGSPEDVGLSTH